jgi:hypothetical protein
MVTRNGKNTDSSSNAAGTSAQPGTVDIPEVCSELTAQLVPPEPIEQSGPEAQASPDSTEKTDATACATFTSHIACRD